jgi:integrase/recombinase XerC/integrase/recombinase XerD
VGGGYRLDRGGTPPLPAAVAAYLATLSGPEQAGTRRAYRSTLRALITEFAPAPQTGTPAVFTVGELATPDNVERLTSWFGKRWNQRAPATFNRNLDALHSAVTYWHNQDWLSADPTRRLRRRTRAPDRTRALSRSDINALLALPDTPLRERVLYRMLYETAARTSEILALDVPDLDLRNRRATVRRKGSAIDAIVWQTGTARLLPRLLNRRTTGPVFLTHRKARIQLAAADLDPTTGHARLSYRRAAEIFNHHTQTLAHPGITNQAELNQLGGWSLHQLRHSALTHAAEDGANTSTLLSYRG